MEFVTIQDKNDPSYIRTVPRKSYEMWPREKNGTGRTSHSGRRIMVIVSKEEAAAAQNPTKAAPRVPEVVQRIQAWAKEEAADVVDEEDEVEEEVAEKPKRGRPKKTA
jgi:hypothetical protein